MFYKTADGHGLPHNPFNAIVVPRPIGWISSLDNDNGVNLAPYSFFNAVAYSPPQVMFAATSNHSQGGLKDTVRNIQETGEFVVNLATWELREQMNASAVPAPHDINEFEYAGLTESKSELVKPPRVAESPVHLECVYTQTVNLLTDEDDNPNTAIFGHVIGIHISDSAITNEGLVDTVGLKPIGRLGYLDYAQVTDSFSIPRPTWG